MEKYEKAEQDYMAGMKYKDIAEKYKTTINTVKSWKKRYGWNRAEGAHKEEKVCTQKEKSVQLDYNISWLEIENEYVTDISRKPCSLEDLAKKYSIPIQTIMDQSAKGKWSDKKSFVDGDIDHTSNSFKPRQEAEKEWKHVKFKTETENMQEYIDKKRERKFFGLPVDETASWIGKDNKIGKVEDLREYFVNGETFKVDGKKVVLDYSQHEKEIANIIAKETGKDIKMVPRITFPQNIQTPDYLIDGIKFDLKTPLGNGKNTLYGMVKSKKRQANNFVICADKTALSIDEIEQQIQGIYTSKNTSFVDTIILVKNEEIVKIYKRNK